MRESESVVATIARRMRSTDVHRGAPECTGKSSNKYADVACALWPRKTAENWAAAAGVQPRIVKYWLAGARVVSPSGKLALIRALDRDEG